MVKIAAFALKTDGSSKVPTLRMIAPGRFGEQRCQGLSLGLVADCMTVTAAFNFHGVLLEFARHTKAEVAARETLIISGVNSVRERGA